MVQIKYNLPLPLPMQDEELEILRPREHMTVSQWAEKYRILSAKTSDLAGPWSNEYTPFNVEIMDALGDVGTRQVTLMKCSQSGGTEISLNFLGYCVDMAPAPTLMVMPTEKDAKKRVATRMKPMIEATPQLLRHLGDIDALNVTKETEFDNMYLYTGWAGSAAALADTPACNVVLDEVGKYPASSGKEADPVSLSKKRQRTFAWRSKLYVGSTPVLEDDLLDREFKNGDMREWWVPCAHCNCWHIMDWRNVILERDENDKFYEPKKYESGGYAHYVCPDCGVQWTEQDRWWAVTEGQWVPDGCEVDENGEIIGHIPNVTHRSYHVSALMLHPRFQTIDNLAAAWVEADLARKHGDFGPLQDFMNSELGVPWKHAQKTSEAEELRSHIGSYPPRIVPAGVQMLTCGVDVQLDHLYVRVQGWGYMSEVWSIWEQRIETGDTDVLANYHPLREFLMTSWPSAEDPNRHFYIRKTGIDCQYHTDTVLNVCRQFSEIDIVPVRGDDSVKTAAYRASKVAGGTMIRYDINVNIVKDRLFRMYHAEVPGPGYFHFHAETTDDVLAQLTAEEQIKIKKGSKTVEIWQKKKSHLDNHYFDDDVYAAFVAELAGARLLSDPTVVQLKAPRRTGVMPRYQR